MTDKLKALDALIATNKNEDDNEEQTNNNEKSNEKSKKSNFSHLFFN